MIRREDIQDLVALTPFQQGVLFHDTAAGRRGQGESQAPNPFFQQIVLDIRGPLDVDAFGRAWQDLVDRHQILRCVYRTSGERGPVQIALKHRPVRLDVRDWRGDDPAAAEAAVADAIAAERLRPFDLTRDLLLRLVLGPVGPDRFVLIWSFHHIVIDGWCIDLLQRELAALYTAAVTGRPAELPPPLPFSRYVAWLHAQRTDDVLDWWPGYLGDAAAVDPVPGFRRRTDRPTLDHRIEIVTASAADTDRLTQACRDRGITPATLVYTLWGLLLARLADRDDVLIGAVASGRTAPIDGIETMLGPCLTALPYRVTIGPADSFGDVLSRAGRHAGAWLASAVCALPDIQVRCARKGPLFSHHVVFENFPIDARFTGDAQPLGPGVSLRQRDIVQATDDPLTVIVHPGRHLHWQIRFDPTVIDPGAAAALAGALGRLLSAVAGDPDQPAQGWSPASPSDADRIWQRWSLGAPAARPLGSAAGTLSALRRTVVDRFGDRPAVLADGSTLSHADLEASAARIAAGLEAHGVGPGDRVAVALPPGRDWLATLIATWRRGAAFVPLSTAGPAHRRAAILRDSQPGLLVADADHPADSGVRQTCPTRLSEAATPSDGGSRPADGDAIAYVIYTSGTTGRPKGVAVSHGAVLNYLGWLNRDAGIGPEDRTALVTAAEFDLGYTAVFGAMLLGGAIALPGDAARRSVTAVTDLIVGQRLTWLKLTPGYLRMLLSDPDSRRLASADGLTRMFLGGEKQDFGLLADLKVLTPSVTVWNHYGPTEATIGCVAGPIDDLVGGADPVQRIGRPIAGMRAAILDRRGQSTAPGWPGELVVAGRGLAAGYHGPVGEAARSFIAHPVLGRAYRTGDRARWRPDGHLEILGRDDAQVKIRGHRVELGEVETVLREVPPVQDAAVLALPDPSGEPVLVAFLVTGKADPPAPAALRIALADRLPEPMIPARFVPLSRLPLTDNGKLDRAALTRAAATAPKPPAGDPARSGDLTATEAVVAPIWAKALSVEHVDPTSDFFALGGHSIKAVMVAAGLRKAFGKRMDIRALFDHPILRDFCAHLDRSGATGAVARPATTLIPLKRGDGGLPALVLAGAVLGTATPYRELIDQIDRPVAAWGFQYPGFDREEPFAPTVPALGEAMADAVLRDLPDGPILLAGWSMGGAVAFEAARRLERQGRGPRGLVLLDTQPPGWRPPGMAAADMAPESLDSLRKAPAWRGILTLLADGLDEEGWARLDRLYRHNVTIARAWRPVNGIRTDILALEAADNTYPIGMAAFDVLTAGLCRVQRVPGTHVSMFQPPHVTGLAAALEQALNRARAIASEPQA